MDNNFDSNYLEEIIKSFCSRLIEKKIISNENIPTIVNFIEYSFKIDGSYDTAENTIERSLIFNPVQNISSEYLKEAFDAFIESHEKEFSVNFKNLDEYLEITSENIGIRVLIALISTLSGVDEKTFKHKKIQKMIDEISLFSRISNDLLDVDINKDNLRKEREVQQKKSYDLATTNELRKNLEKISLRINKFIKNYKPHTKMQEKIFIITKEIYKLSAQTYFLNKESFWKSA